jgi:CubicO group peptidase (beta-lactamase class C family)
VPPLAVAEPDPAGLVDPDASLLPSRSVASWAGPAAGLVGDAPSLARWGHRLYGGEVVGRELVDRMTSGGPQDGYGLGTVRGEVDGERVVGHDNVGLGYQGVLHVLQDRGVSVAVLVPNRIEAHLGTGVDAYDLALEISRTASASGG